ncbi:MAG: hypothetical protein LBG17_07715 [Bacteroidales bacterium]|jgi:hypothetical protein|nr:hypothetical protein [Bacteroidales bacterium]
MVTSDLRTALAPYIIAPALPAVLEWLNTYSVNVTFSERSSHTLGYYMRPYGFGEKQKRHYISIQINLNPYLLLFVFVHEWAHLVVRIKYPQATAHGKEWKRIFAGLMQDFLRDDIFPQEILPALKAFFVKPTATVSPSLINVFNRYGKNRKEYIALYVQCREKGIILPAPNTRG